MLGGGGRQAVYRKGQTNTAVTEAVRLFTLSLCFSCVFSPFFLFNIANLVPRGPEGKAGWRAESGSCGDWWHCLFWRTSLGQSLRRKPAQRRDPPAGWMRSLPASSERRVRISLAAKEQGSQVRLEERGRRNLESFEPPQRKRASPHTPTSKWKFGDS